MINKLFNLQTKTTFAAASLLGITMLVSKILGLVRDRILAATYGAGDELDMYYAAFQIPDFLYMVLILGAVSTAFLPVFTEFFYRDQKEAWKLANQILNLFLFCLIGGGIVLVFLAPWLVKIIAPGFEGEKYETTVRLTQIMFVSPVLFGVSNIIGVILQFFQRFLVYSIAPLLYNIGIIIGAVYLAPVWGIYGLAYGVILGAFMHMVLQLPTAFLCGFRFRATFSFFSEGVRKILMLMAPRSFGLMVSHVSIIIFTAFASAISSGAITVFHFANNIQYLPITVFGVSFAVASFPLLSRLYIERNEEVFFQEFLKTFRKVVAYIIPAAVILFLLRAHIVRVLLGAGNFDWYDTRLTAGALGAFAPGIIFLSLIPLATRAFFARHNTKTPVILNTVGTTLGVFIAMGMLLWLRKEGIFQDHIFAFLDLTDVPNREIIALPFGISFGACANFLLLQYTLLKNQKGICMESLKFFLKVACIAALSGLFGWLSLRATLNVLDATTFLGIFFHGAIGGAAALIAFVMLAYVLRIKEVKDLLSFLRMRRRASKNVQKDINVLQ